jgi:DNA-binding transcriptional LysR family regulator
MRNIDLDALQIFKTVVESGGVARAAARLNRVQSNVSTRLRLLEEDMGAELFHRDGRRLMLTAQGRLLLDYANRLLRLSDEARAAMRDQAPRGTLRIGTMESTAATRLPPLLASYHAAWPHMGIELVTGTSGSLVGKVLRQEVEAAFVAPPFNDEGLEMQAAFRERLVLIAPLSRPPVQGAADLARTSVIAFTTGCSYRCILESWLGQAAVVPERVMEFGSYHAIVACVAAGAGVAIVPQSVVESLRAEQSVRISALPSEISEVQTQLVWRRGYRSTGLSVLRDMLGQAAPPSRETVQGDRQEAATAAVSG